MNDPVLVFDWDGTTYHYEPSRITVRQATVIHGYTGMGLLTWDKALAEGHPKAVAALCWVIKDQAGEKHAVTEFEELEAGRFILAYNEAVAEFVKARVEEELAKEQQDSPKDASAGGDLLTPASTPTLAA